MKGGMISMFDKDYSEMEMGARWTSGARTITEADIVNFANISGDFYALHMDREYAAKSVFGQRIAHGMLVLSYSTGLLDLKPGYVQAFYGMDKVRFVKPVFIGDTIHVELEIVGKKDREKGGVVTVKNEIKNQADETVVACDMKMFMK
jgi:acyl dehydratase